MEAYKKTIRKRLFYFRILMLIAFVLAAGSIYWHWGHEIPESDHIASMVDGMQIGMGFGLMAGLIIHSRKIHKALKDQQFLKKLYIEETDERYKTINMKVNSMTYYIMLYGLLCTCLVIGFFNPTICITLVAVALTMIALRGIIGIYYRMKY